MLARKRHFSKVDNTQTYIVSLRINQLHTLLICPKHTLFNPHTLGLISQAWSNTLIVRRVKSFHYNAGDADPVCGESTTPTPQSLPRHYSLSSFPSCLNLSSDAPISCNSYVSSHSRWVRDDTMGSLIIFCSHHHHHFFFNPCSMCLIWGCSPVVNTLTDYVDWKNIGCRVQCSLKKKWFHMWAQGCLLSQRLHPPLSTSSFLSHTCARPILLHPIHFPLSTHFRVLPPFLSPLWRMNGLVSGAILCPSRRSGVCAASHWSSKWAGNGAGGPGC